MAFGKLTRGQDNAGFQKMEQCGVVEDDWLRMLSDDNLAQKVADQFIASRPPVGLLQLVNPSVAITATTEPFVAADQFKLDISNEAFTRISYLGPNFQKRFLRKVESAMPAHTLKVHTLKRDEVDGPIRAKLGDLEETTLATFWQLLCQQPNGESGVLLTNGYANIFYIKDFEGVLWAVRAAWRGGGWNVSANSVGSPFWWYQGIQVFSRNDPLIA